MKKNLYLLLSCIIVGLFMGVYMFSQYDKENIENTYEQAMENGSRFAALIIARIFRGMGKKNFKILDWGGGTGNYALTILKYSPEAIVHIYERPEMASVCRENINKNKMNKSISVFVSDVIAQNINETYDGVLMSNILHLYDKDTIKIMISEAAQALLSGGLLVLHDFFLRDNHTEPLISLIFTLDWLLIGGDFNYSPKDMEEIGQECGLSLIEVKEYKEIPSSILVFRKD